MFKNRVIVMGASAGGMQIVSKILAELPQDFPAALFVVIHLQRHTISHLSTILGRSTKLSTVNPIDGQEIKGGYVYIAPPDYHMLIQDGHVRLLHGPRVNYSRPAIDPLFRSAAVAYGPKVIGILLSGMLDDGSAGMLAIKRRGGLTIVQSPEEAEFPDMPRNALSYLPIDCSLPVTNIAPLLVEQVNQSMTSIEPAIDNLLEIESRMNITSNEIKQSDMDKIGKPSVFTCPECHGTLWEIEDKSITRFRCRVGHAFGLESLSACLSDNVEEALWAALRVLEEKANLSERIAERAIQEKLENILIFSEKAKLARKHAETIRNVLLSDGNESDTIT